MFPELFHRFQSRKFQSQNLHRPPVPITYERSRGEIEAQREQNIHKSTNQYVYTYLDFG